VELGRFELAAPVADDAHEQKKIIRSDPEAGWDRGAAIRCSNCGRPCI
jgi:hypothetical protein